MTEVPSDRLNREELYRLVWEKPLNAIGQEFGVSASIISRACRQLNVPKPPFGYWTKIAHGYKVHQPPLPALKAGEKEEWQRRIKHTNTEGPLTATQHRKQLDAVELDEATREWLYGDLPEHRWIQSTRTALKGTWTPTGGRVDQQLHIPHFSMSTSKGAQKRALDFLNRLVHLAEREGILVHPDTPAQPISRNPWDYVPANIVQFYWKDQEVGIHLNERMRRTEKPNSDRSDRFEYEPTGRLDCTLVNDCAFAGRTYWKDGKRQQIEAFIPSIVEAIKAIAEQKTVYLAQEAIKKERQRQIDSIMAGLRHQEYQEEFALKRAMDDAASFAQAETLRSFANVAEARLSAHGRVIQPGSGIALWLQWLHLRADMIDPLAPGKAPWEPFVKNVLKTEP